LKFSEANVSPEWKEAAMSQEKNLEIARKAWDALNAHSVDRWTKLLDEKFIWESDTLPEPVRGRDTAHRMMQMYLRALPDLQFAIDQMISDGDYIVTRYTATGTHRGELMGIAATNRRAGIHGCTVTEFRNGKLVHSWGYWDTGHLLRQLGVLPHPEAAKAVAG